MLSGESFDLVLLDIMGVRGFELLEQCRQKQFPAAMLTAHAVSVESVNRALNLGAVSFLPKDELTNLAGTRGRYLRRVVQRKKPLAEVI